jgi:hypothetical protein
MDDRAGHTAIFAAEGSARQHLGRAAIAVAVALLAAWLIALALGVLGGFGSLPGLPSSHSSHDNEVRSSTTHSRTAAPEAPLRVQRTASDTRTATPSPSHTTATSNPTRSQSNPKPTVKPVVPAPSPPSTSPSTGHGQSGTRTTTAGKPVGLPGNGSGGTGAPGQLR